MSPFNSTAGSLSESETLAIAAAAKRLRAQGVAIAPFAAGEPDFPTPDYVIQAAEKAMREGRTKYGPSAGNAELREVVAHEFSRAGLSDLTPDRTLISMGAKGVLYLAIQVLISPGDEVLIPAPCWLSYAQMVQAAGGRCVFVPTFSKDGFVIDPERVRAAVTPKTRMLILNSPGNPSGAVQPVHIQHALGQIALQHQIVVISDEIYEHMVYAPAEFRSFAAAAPEARDLTLLVNGVSKAYAMTGWRIGYGAGPKAWIERMIRLQSHAFSGPPEIMQAAALAALTGPADALRRMQAAFTRRREVMHSLLAKVPDLVTPRPDGAFYMLPDVSAYLEASHQGEKVGTATRLAALLMEHAHAAVVPGNAFEAPSCLRFSYACSEAEIESGLARVARFLGSLVR